MEMDISVRDIENNHLNNLYTWKTNTFPFHQHHQLFLCSLRMIQIRDTEFNLQLRFSPMGDFSMFNQKVGRNRKTNKKREEKKTNQRRFRETQEIKQSREMDRKKVEPGTYGHIAGK
jgi:hypothetical protein